MGIILGALGGAGTAAQEAGATMMKSDLDTQRQIDVAGATSNLELQRQEALEQFKVDSANRMREAQASRIDTAAQPILEQGIIGRARAARANNLPQYDGNTDQPASFHGDASQTLAGINALPAGPDKDAALAQFKSQMQGQIANNANVGSADLTSSERSQFAPSSSDITHARTQAAIQTGDISPTDAARLASSSEITQMKMQSLLDRANDRNATMQDVANVRADAMKYGYELRLQAAQEKQANGKIDTATTRMLITSEDANIRASTSQLGMLNTQIANVAPKGRDGKPNPDYDAIKGQMDSLRADIAASKKTKIDLFKSLGIVPDDSGADDTDTPPAATPPTPAASRPPLTSFMK